MSQKLEDLLKQKNPEEIWVCSVCGSLEVQSVVWAEINTGKITEDYPDEDDWCPDCCMEVTAITLDEWDDKYSE